MGLLRARLGGLVVLGSSRKCLIDAMVSGDGFNAQRICQRKARSISQLDTLTGDYCIFAEFIGHFFSSIGNFNLSACFASDPERGVFMLIFLAVVVGASLMLFALRGPAMQKVAAYSGWSREVMLLINNVILVSSMVMILIGTLYPLVADVLELGKISVGPPYFNFFFVPLTFGLVVALGIAVFTKWKTTELRLILGKIPVPLLIAIIAACVLPFYLTNDYSYSITAGLTLFMTLWLIATIAKDLIEKIGINIRRIAKLSYSYLGMQLAHTGLAICILGVGLSSAYDQTRELQNGAR